MKGWRAPLLALLPLALGLAAYWVYWRGQADAFAARVEAVLGGPVGVGGFPYRLSAELGELDIRRGGEAAFVRLRAGPAAISRQPFRDSLHVGTFADVDLAAQAADLAGAHAVVEAPLARASLRVGPTGLVERLSARFETARVRLGWLATPLEASGLELHLRETPNANPAEGPRPPGQAEARVTGVFRAADGTEVRLDLPIEITADAPLASVAAWRDGGTLEIDGGTIAGTGGEPLAGFDATVAALPDGGLALAGTLTSDCPATVLALFGEGEPPAQEFRTRRPARFALTGMLDAPRLGRKPGASGGAARSLEPPCPALRR